MGLTADVENALFDLLDTEMFGCEMIIDGDPVTGIWQPEQANQAGSFSGSIVERFRLVVSRDDVQAVVGQEIEMNGLRYTVISVRHLETMSDIVLERYTA